jgi:hypothetical protein
MRLIRDVLVCVLLAVLIASAVYGILFMRAATETVTAVPAEIAATRAALIGEVRAGRVALLGDGSATVPLPLAQQVLYRIDARAADITERADNQATALRTDVMAEVKAIHADSNQRFGDTLARVDTALKTVEGVRADLKPVLDGAVALEADTDKTVTDLRPQLLGLVAASKVTAGEAATTMREIQRATPEILGSVKDATAHIDTATEASATASANAAAVTGNLAAATKPLPRAVRVGLQIGGPVAQMTSYVILMLATLGVL